MGSGNIFEVYDLQFKNRHPISCRLSKPLFDRAPVTLGCKLITIHSSPRILQ